MGWDPEFQWRPHAGNPGNRAREGSSTARRMRPKPAEVRPEVKP